MNQHRLSMRFLHWILSAMCVMCVSVTSGNSGDTKLELPALLSDDMVLAAAPRKAILYGWADPNATIAIEVTGAYSLQKTTTANSTGGWTSVLGSMLPTTTPSGIVVTATSTNGSASVTLNRVLFGDIIICGGQSNMQFSLNLAFNGTAEIAAAGNYSRSLRLLTVERTIATFPQNDAKLVQKWSVSSPSTVDDNTPFGVFSAECYLTGRRLVDLRPSVPIGLVSSCWSGSMIQPWIPPDSMSKCPYAKAVGTNSPFQDSMMFNAMIAPIVNLNPAGVLWHQGEENAGNPVEYNCFFRALITGWRGWFKSSSLPFMFVQLQPCGIPPEQRFAQAAALELDNVKMAVAADLLDASTNDTICDGFNQFPNCSNPYGMCHTRWKEDIAERLTAVASQLIFNATDASRAKDLVIPESPQIGTVVNITQKDYRTYVVHVYLDGVDSRITSIAAGPTKSCTLCCRTSSFAIQYASDAPGEHWMPLGLLPDKHGVPLEYDARLKQLSITMVIEPPFKPYRIRHAWADAPQCMMFGLSNETAPNGTPWIVPFAPFNITLS